MIKLHISLIGTIWVKRKNRLIFEQTIIVYDKNEVNRDIAHTTHLHQLSNLTNNIINTTDKRCLMTENKNMESTFVAHLHNLIKVSNYAAITIGLW